MARAPPLVVSIEGSIGVGKTTVIDALKQLFQDNERVAVLREPVDQWEEHGFLSAMYENKLEPCAFQHCVLMSLAGSLLQKLHERDYSLIITERSARGNYHIFGKANLEVDTIEHDLFKFTYDNVMTSFPPDMRHEFIHLKADTAVAKARMLARGREAESNVSDAYLEKINRLHDEWLTREAAVTTVYAGTMSKDAVLKEVKMQLSRTVADFLEPQTSLSQAQKMALIAAAARLMA